jgi:predicted RNA-binding Zn-ribbon protein involved in translation (DUF1610 family)
MDITTITAAYEGLKAVKEILKSIYNVKVEADAKEKIEEVMSKLGEAQDALFSMREELFRLQSDNDSLKKKIEEAESWDTKLSQYELTKTSGGAVVYKFIGEPEHFICPSCVSKKNIEILQDNRTYSGKYRCVGCGAEFPINPKTDSPVRRSLRA